MSNKNRTHNVKAKGVEVNDVEVNDVEVNDVEVKKPEFYVMKGKSLTTMRGILADGEEIKAEDLPGGEEALESFVESGYIGRSK